MHVLEAKETGPDGLEGLRAELDEADSALVELLARRCGLARAIADVKTRAGLPIVDPAREAAVVRRAAKLARERAVDEEAVRRIFWSVIDLARRIELEEAM
jgi:chorismate mutase